MNQVVRLRYGQGVVCFYFVCGVAGVGVDGVRQRMFKLRLRTLCRTLGTAEDPFFRGPSTPQLRETLCVV